MTSVSIRSACIEDAEAMLAIYAPVVMNTAISFEMRPPSVAEFTSRIEASLERWAWLVAEQHGKVIGYAYATSHRARDAYWWSVETSLYIDGANRGSGVGSALYGALLPVLIDLGYCNAYAGITVPNDASMALHRRMGFQPVGVFPKVGRKFGRWHDVAWWHRPLRALPPPRGDPA